MDTEIIETDLLIVGAGPAGAALACFLASYGISLGNSCSSPALMLTNPTGRTGIMIAAAPSCAETPRAHITNMAALGKANTTYWAV
jgi:thioredoxin reductase